MVRTVFIYIYVHIYIYYADKCIYIYGWLSLNKKWYFFVWHQRVSIPFPRFNRRRTFLGCFLQRAGRMSEETRSGKYDVVCFGGFKDAQKISKTNSPFLGWGSQSVCFFWGWCSKYVVLLRANPSVCPRRRRRHVRTSKNTVFCGTKCTCPWSWLSSCNAQLSYLCVECYNNNIIIIINIININIINIIIIII